MAFSLYDASIPVYVRLLRNLAAILEKGEAHAKQAGVALETLAQARLAPDMGALIRQVQFASDSAKGGAARLAQVEAPSFPDEETTFPELHDRIAKTLAFLETITREQVDGGEERTVELKVPQRTLTFVARDFLLFFSLPNFMFHVTMAYAILRNQGVPLGKLDYLGPLPTI